MRESSAGREEKAVYIPEPDIEGPPSYTEAASASASSGSRVNFAPPGTPRLSEAAVGTSPLLVQTISTASTPARSIAHSSGSGMNGGTLTGVSATARATELEHPSSHASSVYDPPESPLTSTSSSPVSPLTPFDLTSPIHVQHMGVIGHGTLVEAPAVKRYNSIAVQNPFASPTDLASTQEGHRF